MAISLSQDGHYEITQVKVVALFVGLLVSHGILVCPFCKESDISTNIRQNSLTTRRLARFSSSFIFINLGATFGLSFWVLNTLFISSDASCSRHHRLACHDAAEVDAFYVIRIWFGRCGERHWWMEYRDCVLAWFVKRSVDCESPLSPKSSIVNFSSR
jgi:hypothetical protein